MLKRAPRKIRGARADREVPPFSITQVIENEANWKARFRFVWKNCLHDNFSIFPKNPSLGFFNQGSEKHGFPLPSFSVANGHRKWRHILCRAQSSRKNRVFRVLRKGTSQNTPKGEPMGIYKAQSMTNTHFAICLADR